MSQLQYPLKDVPLVIGRVDWGTSTIHVKGCGHTAKLDTVHDLTNVPHEADGAFEDYYPVAPCARNGKANKLTIDH